MTRSICSTILVLLVLAASPIRPSVAQSLHWDLLPNAPVVDGFRHDDIRFLDDRLGWLVNQSGEIWRTQDSGQSWERQVDLRGRGVLFRSVAVTTDTTVFVGTILTPGHALWGTSDGGATWEDISDRISGPEVAAICGLWPINDHTAVGLGAFYGEPRIIRTEDNGLTWTSTSGSPAAETLVDLYFRDELTGFATGGSSLSLEGNTVITRTDDGGRTWRRVYESEKPDGVDGEWGWKFSFPSDEVGYLAVEYSNNDLGKPAKVLKTVDGGETWIEIFIEGSISKAGLQAVGFISEAVGWASGRGVTSMTTDGGESWTQLSHWNPTIPGGQLDGSINRFFMVNDTFAVAIGQRVYTLKGQQTPTAVERPAERPLSFRIQSAYPNPFRESTRLTISLDEQASVRVWVIDMLGRRHGELVSGLLGPGDHQVTWDGRALDGSRLPSGTYLLLIDVGDSREMKQVVRIR